jgi:hypothetical protein
MRSLLRLNATATLTAMSLHFRASQLSHAALVDLVVAACQASPAMKNLADEQIAKVVRQTSRNSVLRPWSYLF